MKQSFYILLITGASAIVATILARSWGFREDFGSAIGGILGLTASNGTAFVFRGAMVRGGSSSEALTDSRTLELGFAYGVFAIAYFAFVGWLTGYVHKHGELAGTVCGGCGGYILAVTIPAIHRSPFMSLGRQLQLVLSCLVFVALLGIVWVMYKHEIQ